MPREHPLARVEREVKLAPRQRLDLVEEVDADVRAMQAEMERRGYSPAEARREAIRRLVPAGEVVEQLEDRHAPGLGRWLRAEGRWLHADGSGDRVTGLGIGAAALLGGAVGIVATVRPGSSGTAMVLSWGLVIVFSLLVANLARVAAQLWLHGDLRVRQRRLLWARHAGLIVTAVALGALGAAWEGYLVLTNTEQVDSSALLAWETAGAMAHFPASGLAAAIFGLFGWLAISPRLIADQEIERRITEFFAQDRARLTLNTSAPSIHESKGDP
ncbi:MAG: hypothetical protein F4Z31_12210 [Gemmatimonadetes bacterium]|nr:hypothetical protein [Gemmatimonadota bacterium]MYA42505.1 hypothetical protein [Gemmatimonadota bacterium]MYE95649.1 hypothetical protein [Gemmatimonadota bacterium]